MQNCDLGSCYDDVIVRMIREFAVLPRSLSCTKNHSLKHKQTIACYCFSITDLAIFLFLQCESKNMPLYFCL